MNIETLKCFILVAENLNFARAAEALYISQPAVTKQINALEAELGTTLFIRSTRHVELTSAGISFYKDAKEIVHKSEAATNRIRLQNPDTQSLRIGISNSTALNTLAPLLAEFHKEYPEIIPDIEVLNYKTVLNLFTENKLDVIFYYKENMTTSAGIRFREIKQDKLMCLIPANHKLADEREIALEMLKTEKIIACNPLNAPLSISRLQQKLLTNHPSDSVIYCNTIETAHCMTAANMGITVLPETLCPGEGNIKVIPLRTDMQLFFGCFYHTKNKNESLYKFIKII